MRVDHHHGELEQVVVAERDGRHDGEQQHARRSARAASFRSARTEAPVLPQESVARSSAYTLLSTVRPIRPDGFTTSTATMMTSASVSFSSVPTT